MEEAKLAEIKKDAEKEKLNKLLKDLETLRDNAKTIYKMAASYKLSGIPTVAKIDIKKSPLQKLYDEITSFVNDRKGWGATLLEAARSDDDEEEEGVIASEAEDNEDEIGRHHQTDSAQPVVKERKFDCAYIEVVPPEDFFAGTVQFYPANTAIVVNVCLEGVEDAQKFLCSLPLDASMLLMAEGQESGVAFRWVQVAAGLDCDLSFADSQRCLLAFFTALANTNQMEIESISCSGTNE